MPVEEITREEKRIYSMRELEVKLEEEYGKVKGKRTIKQWRNHAGKFYDALTSSGIEIGPREKYMIECVNGLYENREKILSHLESDS